MALPRLTAMNTHSTTLLAALVLAGLLASASVRAQFQTTPAVAGASKYPSAATTEREYRKDGARHLYAAYGTHIHKGKMPPLLYGVAIIETEIGAGGEVRDVRVVRQPAAAEVGPWAVTMIKKASPFPAPATMGAVKYTEIWLVDKSGHFQLDSLTEGQR
jgi:periplasmic protein TonB